MLSATVTAATAAAGPGPWLAGNPGPAPALSSASVIFTVSALVLVFGAFTVGTWPRRRLEAPLRDQIRSRSLVTFHARVDVKASVLGLMLPARGLLNLTVRGDAFEVSHPFPPVRVMFGQVYCYRADQVTVEALPGLRRDWIEINGPARSAARIQVGRKKQNRAIWDALVAAGAQPISPPPQADR
jgi:hypothetical protein